MKHLVFAAGRFNPPTKGHEKVITSVARMAKLQNADHMIWMHHLENEDMNPVSLALKYDVLTRTFPEINFVKSVPGEDYDSFMYDLMHQYDHICIWAGSDTIDWYKDAGIKLLSRYYEENAISLGDNLVPWVTFSYHCAGIREECLYSASKVRAFAKNGSWHAFHNYLPDSMSFEDKQSLFWAIRSRT